MICRLVVQGILLGREIPIVVHFGVALFPFFNIVTQILFLLRIKERKKRNVICDEAFKLKKMRYTVVDILKPSHIS